VSCTTHCVETTKERLGVPIGSIDNFPSAATLKAYFDWVPQIAQSGTTMNRAKLARGGTRTMKQMMLLIVAQTIRLKTNEYAALYERLVQAKCPYDERTGRYKRNLPVMGRVAGQMTELIYALLKRDTELVAAARPGQELPQPVLYDDELHHRHRHGEYTPSKPVKQPTPITLQHPRCP